MASAALVDAGIDCVDLVSGGVAALVREDEGGDGRGRDGEAAQMVLDPAPSEHDVKAACVVAYLQSRDEITELWMKGDAGVQTETLIDEAVKAANLTRSVLAEAVKESVEIKMSKALETEKVNGELASGKENKDVVMAG